MKLRTRGRVPETLEEIFKSPLLKDVQPAKPKPKPVASDPVVMNFIEILEFVHTHHREPMPGDPTEVSLARKLKAYRTKPALAATVRQYDDAGLLAGTVPQTVQEVHGETLDEAQAPSVTQTENQETPPVPVEDEVPEAPEAPEAPGWDAEAGYWKPGYGPMGTVQTVEAENASEAHEAKYTSLDDILNGPDALGLLAGSNTDIFELKHVSSYADRKAAEAPDEIAQRRPCQDFWRYERFFQQALSILKTKDVLLQKPLEAHARPGALFILRGQLCYVDSVLEGRSGKEGHGGENRRLHCVFDNGTELDILTFSLMRALYADKHAKFVNMAPNLFSEHVVSVTAKDQPTGFVYVLETLSTAPELAELKARRHLVKIGYSTQPVDKRIAGAEKDQTYLCAPVRKAAEIACFNLNPQKFEHLIHGFLNKQKLAVKLVNARTGKVYEPKEWFTVSVQTAIDVCRHIVDGDISLYRMNNVTGEIVKK